MEPRLRPEATVRALVVRDGAILLVSNTGDYWYTPGGRIEHGESAQDALLRELREETGLSGRVAGFSHVEEFFKPSKGLHHINLFFYVEAHGMPRIGDDGADCNDPDGPVTRVRFFTPEAMRGLAVYPASLREGWWRQPVLHPRAWGGADRA